MRTHTHTRVCVCVYIYIYIYMYTHPKIGIPQRGPTEKQFISSNLGLL